MSTELAKTSIRLSLIVAMNNSNRGIGIKGKLPWRIPKDMKHFARVTTYTADPYKKNAVIMGRLTWQSIPKGLRPLPNRINVIISSQLTKETCDYSEKANLDDIVICKSFDEAVELLVGVEYADKIENIYAIGGSQIYKSCLEPKYLTSGFMHRIYMTRVYSDVECDTFFEPADFLESFQKLTEIDDAKNFNVDFNTMQTEPAKNSDTPELKYCFEIYEKSF